MLQAIVPSLQKKMMGGHVVWLTLKTMCIIVFMSIRSIYRLYINVLAWTHVGIYVISNTVMYCFQNSFIILNVSYLITPMMGHVVYEITYN